MATIGKDGVREFRIANKILAAAQEGEEAALAWYYHLEEIFRAPFTARLRAPQSGAPLNEGDTLTVLELADVAACREQIMITADYNGQPFTIPLAHLDPLDADEETTEAVADWHYWLARGYEF
jgi:hypothetical protein